MHSAGANTIVTASAGTGKTYRLVSEFVEAVLGNGSQESPVHPRSILALTFTEKAAAEMRTRISKRLFDVDVPKHSTRRKFSRELDQATITTYHSFCAKILRDYSEHVGLDSRFQLLDPYEESELALKIARRVVLHHLEIGTPALLSLVARLQFEGNGDAKGVVGYLVRIREQLIENGASPYSLQGSSALPPDELMSSPQLASALRQCVQALEAYNPCLDSLSAGAKTKIASARAEFARLAQTLSRAEVKQLEINISSIFASLRQSISGRFGPDDLRKNLVSSVTHLGSLLCASFVAPEENAFRLLISEHWIELEAEKKRSMRLGFGDLLVLTRRLLRENLLVRRELKSRFQRVLVDEYQDTSPIQEDIVALICENAEDEQALAPHESALGALQLSPGKLFVVGDPKQSIYGFRGSDATLFHKMADEIAKQGGKRESLNISRRSSASVITAINSVVECDPDEQLVGMHEGMSCAGALLKTPSEADGIAAEVVALLSARSSIANDRSFEPKDVAILVRRVKKAGPILQALSQAGVPVRLSGGEGFFERQEVVELVSALLLVIHPEDSLALLTVMRSPLLDFPDYSWAHLFAVLQESKEGWTLDALAKAFAMENFEEAFVQRFHKLRTKLEGIRENLSTISAVEAFEQLLGDGEYFEALASEPEANLCFANIQKLKSLLLKSEGDFTTQIEELADKVRQAPKEALGEEEVEANAVRIMTIHQSKGLEFPVVFVADTSASIPSESADLLFDSELGIALSHRGRPIAVCAPESKEWIQRFPTPIQAVRARLRSKNESELSRLLYVALTRARDLVYFVDEADVSEAVKSVARGCTLSSLFMRGYEAKIELMCTLMPKLTNLAEICHASEGWHPEHNASNWMPAFAGMTNRQASIRADRKLLFASDLLATPMEDSGLLRAQRLVYQKKHLDDAVVLSSSSEMGRIAHSLIRAATEQMTETEFDDQATIRGVLGAALRIQGYSIELTEVVNKCIVTLESVIWPLLKAGFTFRFEVPMQYENDHCVVKGFADAIALRGDLACLIDFKSSVYAAHSERTKLQLLAYCAALRQHSDKRVFFATCVIGEREELQFEAFDEDGQSKLDACISSHTWL